MKIAFVTNTCWNVYNFREGLVRHFLARGDEVLSLAPRDAYTSELESWGVKFIETPLDQTGTNPIKDALYLFKLWRIIKSEEPDVILSFTIKSNIYSSLAGRLNGIPTICNVSGLGTVFLVKGWLGKFAIELYKFSFKFSSFIFFQNNDDKDLFLSFVNIESERFGLLPGSGINLRKFSYSIPEITSPTRVLMVSRIIKEKGVYEFVEAGRILREQDIDVEFTLVGNLDESHMRSITSEEMNAWIDEGLVTYIPHADNVQELMTQFELIVLPSYREGTPRTLLEGAALGRTVMASDVPGCREVVKDGKNGFLFKVRNPGSIVEKIKLYLALTKQEKLTLAKNSRKIAESEFDENYVIDKYVETISQIVDN